MQMTDLSGMNPTVQNTGAQQQMYQQNMNNMGSLANQALDTKGTQMAKFDPKSMANALRNNSSNIDSFKLPQLDQQTSGVAGMGDSMGTGLVYGGVNFGEMNPNSTGGFGLKPVSNMPVVGAYGQLMPNN